MAFKKITKKRFFQELDDQQDTYELTTKGYGLANKHNVIM